MTVSIIIVNYNVSYYLELCLDSVRSAIKSMDAEVIVVDNASTDESLEMVRAKFPEVHIIANEDNRGFSSANNQGVAVANGEYVCILNPDTVVTENTFEEVHAFAKAKKKLGAIGVRLVDGTGTYLPESKRNLPTPKVSLNKIMGDGSAYYANQLSSVEDGKVAVLVGAFMFLRKSVYEEVGGFDERYFMYGEDIDLSYTIEQAGYDNFYLGATAVIHFKGESTIKNSIYRERFFEAMRIFYEKHFRKNSLKNFLINTGLKGARLKSELLSISSKNSKETLRLPVAHYVLVSDNELLYDALAIAVSKPTTLRSTIRTPEKGEELIFDASYLTYKEIICTIVRHQANGGTYKIIPKNCTFAVGSDSSKGRGEVIHF